MNIFFRIIRKLLPAHKKLVFDCFLDRRFKYKTHKYDTLSQAGQDYWVIYEVFNQKRNGYFVEIGSTDGVNINNTYLLEQRYGWEGICIEPNPQKFQRLVINRNAICLNTCVDSEERRVNFMVSGLNSGILDNLDEEFIQKNRKRSRMIEVETRRLADILNVNDAPKIIDYLSVDVEGAEERVLLNFPFEEYLFRTITIERPSSKLQNYLGDNGYVLVKKIPRLDYFYVHETYIKNYKENIFNYYWRTKKLYEGNG